MSLYQRFHDRFGTAGVILGVIALILALGGTALAASGLNSKQKKEVKNMIKKYSKPGPQGPQGPQGNPGPPGPAGKDGTNGTNGTNGKDGNSVVVAPEEKGANCTQGGVKVTVEETAGQNYVCNGQTGFTDHLPSGKTETGTWAVGISGAAYMVAIEFNIPLEEAPELGFVNVAGEEAGDNEEEPHAVEHCTGSAEEPSAPAGYVCIYGASENIEGFGFVWPAAGNINTFVSGAVFPYTAGAGKSAWGTWAVTAP